MAHPKIVDIVVSQIIDMVEKNWDFFSELDKVNIEIVGIEWLEQHIDNFELA